MHICIVERAVTRAMLFAVLTAVLFGLGGLYVFAQDGEENYEEALGVVPEEEVDEVMSDDMTEVVVADEVSEEEAEVDTEKTPTYTVFSDAKFTVTPVVANEKAKPRDIIKKELIVTNNTDHRLDLYISVENIDPNEGAQEFVSPGVSDLSTSLANWVEITRGVIELEAGESRKIPYLIHVNLTAQPGSYYARIQFKEGPKRAEATASAEGSALMLNLEVEDDAIERLQLGNFLSEDSVIFGNSVSFSYLLENVGNRLIEPRGSIRIFNRRGEEVGSVPLNADGDEITPENKEQLAAVWNATGRFGKYKAYLDLEYGESQLASVQDTVYFWVFPWKEILTALLGVLLLGVVGTYIVHMRSIARPVPARSRQMQHAGQSGGHRGVVPSPQQVRHPTITQVMPAVAPAPVQATPAKSLKHLDILHANMKKPQTAVQGDTVRLGSVSEKRGGQVVTLGRNVPQEEVRVNGNVVQLSSHRK